MKKHLLLLFACALQTTAFAQLQKPQALSGSSKLSQFRLEETISKPTKAQSYYWSTGSSSYVLSNTSTFTYDSQGRILTQETRTEGTNALQSKNTYAYDQSGNQILSESLSYYEGEISNGSRYSREYDGIDNIYSLSESYVASTKKWKTSYGYKHLLEKDSKGNVVKETTQEADTNAQFTNTQLVEYTYNEANQISWGQVSVWEDAKWVPFERLTDIVWHNVEKFQLTSYKTQKWNGTEWIGQYQYTGNLQNEIWIVTTDTLVGANYVHLSQRSVGDHPLTWANGEPFSYEKEENFINGTWKTTREFSVALPTADTLLTQTLNYNYDESGNLTGGSLQTQKYDSKGKRISSLYETEDESETRTLSSGTIYRYEYDLAGNLLSEEIDNYNSVSKTFVKSGKTVYGDFTTFEVTGLKDSKKGEAQFTVFPNPSHDGIFQLQEAVRFSVFDSLGQELFKSEGEILNLSTYKRGIYFIQVNTSKGIVNKKLVRE